MSRLVLAFSAMLLVLATLTIAPTEAIAQELVVQRDVTVRSRPARRAVPVTYVNPGDRLELLDDGRQRNGYYHVRLPDGRTGWVYRSFVRRADPGLVPPAPPPPAGELSVHYIDVGQGDSTLVLCPNGNSMLIDAGSTSGTSAATLRTYITSQLRQTGGDIDYLIVSHPDADHYNLIPDALAQTPVGLAFYVGARNDYNDARVFDWITRTPSRALRLSREDHDPEGQPNRSIDCGAAQVWILAAATPATASPKNAWSIVVMVRMGDFETMITGDATFDTENVVMSRYSPAWLDIDVLRVGHHGSRATSTQERWAQTVRAERSIFSAGHRNNYGHPHRDVVTRLARFSEMVPAHPFRDATGSRPNFTFHGQGTYREGLYSTATSGTIVVRTDGTGFTFQTAR